MTLFWKLGNRPRTHEAWVIQIQTPMLWHSIAISRWGQLTHHVRCAFNINTMQKAFVCISNYHFPLATCIRRISFLVAKMAFKYTVVIVCAIAISCNGQSYDQVSICVIFLGWAAKHGLDFVFHAIKSARALKMIHQPRSVKIFQKLSRILELKHTILSASPIIIIPGKLLAGPSE